MVFSPDGRFILSASFDKSVKLWDGAKGTFLATLRGHVGPVYQVAWSADSRMFASGSKDSTLKVRGVGGGSRCWGRGCLCGAKRQVLLRVRPGTDARVPLWRCGQPAATTRPATPALASGLRTPFTHCALSPPSPPSVLHGRLPPSLPLPSPCLQVWDARTRKLKVDLPGHADEVFTVDWSPDGGSVASGGKDRVLKLWRH